MTVSTIPQKRNNSISYVKGCAILGVVLIHLLDWSEVRWSSAVRDAMQLLYPFVLMFLATSGSVMVLASRKYPFPVFARRIVKRGLEIYAVYFAYSAIKFLIYDFDKQPFYDQFRHNGTLTFTHIFTLRAFDVPITILLTIAFFVVISPWILALVQKTKFPKTALVALILILGILNYAVPHPDNALVNFFYSKGYVHFPIALWAIPFLIGILLSFLDIDKTKFWQLPVWLILTGVSYWWWKHSGRTEWQPSAAMYPLYPYYISFSFLCMTVLIIMFSFLEKWHQPVINKGLSVLQLFGDNTLELYIAHWIVIDLTSWFLNTRMILIWLFVPLLFVGFAVWRRKRNQTPKGD